MASPATVSRCGFVYINEDALDSLSLITNNINKAFNSFL